MDGEFTPSPPIVPGAFTAETPESAGQFSGLVNYGPIVNSTYGELGGTYGDLDYVYGGYLNTYRLASEPSTEEFAESTAPSVGVFVPS